MKQHMLTHKIRDMPQHMFDKPPSVSGDESNQSQPPPPPPPPREPAHEPVEQKIPQPPVQQPPVPLQQPIPLPQEVPKECPAKREQPDNELPLSKRPSSKFYLLLNKFSTLSTHKN